MRTMMVLKTETENDDGFERQTGNDDGSERQIE